MGLLKDREILLIDDAEDVRLLGRKILENDGALVQTASSVEEAKICLEKKIPHLIILDLQMNGQDGFDFLRFRRESLEVKRVPVLVMSGLTDKDSVIKAISLGADAYLLKPLRNTALLQKVSKILKVAGTHSFQFSEKERPEVTLTLNAEIFALSEAGMDVVAPAKIAAGAAVNLSTTLLNELKLDSCPLRNTQLGGKYSQPGYYLNRVNFVGIGEEAVKNIRNFMRGLK